MTLNQIIGVISDRAGHPFDANLQAELKVIVQYKRTLLMHRLLTKNPQQRKFFTQTLVVKLTEVTESECPIDIDTDCAALKSVVKIPKPIRSNILFDFVGSADLRQGYGRMRSEFLAYNAANVYTSNTSKHPKWDYNGGYLYVYGNLKIQYIGVRGIFEVPELINECDISKENCYSADTEYPISGDLIDVIVKDILTNELRRLMPEIGEVNVDQNEDQQVKVED